MAHSRILVAGIGNVFYGDDAFGVEVVRRLRERPLPTGVEAVDFGIRGFDLACALIEGYDAAILVDAVSRGGEPGTLYVIEPDVAAIVGESPPPLGGHSLDPAQAIHYAQALGGRLPPLRLVGCEPAVFGTPDEPQTELSPAAAAAVDRAVAAVLALVWQLGAREPGCTPAG